MPHFYYYHTDRNGSLKPNQVIGLVYDKEKLSEFNTDRSRALAAFLPDGVTAHGYNYLIEENRPQPHQDTNGLIEMLAEWIRQTRYPHLPSRLQSFFAWRTVEDARAFATMSALNAPVGTPTRAAIWEVEAEPSLFESDMNRLKLGSCWLDALVYLDAYWNQDYTPTPMIEVLLKPPVRILRPIAWR